MRTAPDLKTATWRKSSYSGGNSAECVEVSDGHPGLVPVRDSKNPAGGVLVFGAAAWSHFVAAAREG
ncbi:DUF397 domain-containing protein [Streptomyces stelliscabiei]|uniref:DUF397 domain-containing protein n=1 Tax=Streptomyces stelliscabiei TaxID=146820 RepID=A0A8I0TSP1_9ACTN|nr:DUF397 domain-containing protein [Streptomyces stelliscabiei]KND41013.1 regulatory protein [Streptomyces stelliscabiei]MBE1598176.1 hypothetical protein [Streptomyces stelliscabiei]MDX2520990.1 DUF397 domain-containing protein [Streptomyces stelliscabiei]MDX2555896.1 DUF397 domain-containing protein [Streptomyces stelliscabiei]MDX2616501.1 DUF397 domain-containing protein [Streptomyces stelliscabiei]